jgi:UPF0042 nucleotide-binding protein
MSGAGRSSSLRALEDCGYEAIDNLPLQFWSQTIADFYDAGTHRHRGLAIGVDVRTRGFSVAIFSEYLLALKANQDLNIAFVFLDCEDDVLRRRFNETRRRHPLAPDRPVMDGIVIERTRLAPLRAFADLSIDTSTTSLPVLRGLLQDRVAADDRIGLTLSIVSFSYKKGLPRSADLVFDVRFLANPHYVPELKEGTGRDPAVADFVRQDPAFEIFFANLQTMLKQLIPAYEIEGKSYLTIAVGCTGGQHRSVFVAEQLAAVQQEGQTTVSLIHRELDHISG